MRSSVSVRYALRSLWRHLRRTLLSIVGIAFGVGLGLIAFAWIRGEHTMSVNAAAAGGVGHLRLVPEGWNERRTIEMRLPAGWEQVLARLRDHEGIAVATPRARIGGLLAMGTRSTHIRLTGVDAATEPQALRYVREIPEGRYLEPGATGEVVIGRTIADRLRVELEDELVVTTVDAAGEMRSALLLVVGIAETGSRNIDAEIAHVALEDVQALSGRQGAAEITLLVSDVHAIGRLHAELGPEAPPGSELLSWLELSPELRQNLEGDGAFFDIAISIVLFVVLMGVASAQLTSVLERRKEFAMLAALGMRGWQLVRVVLTEGLLLGTISALAALAWSCPILYDWSKEGIDLSQLMDLGEGSWEFGGLLIDPIFFPEFGSWVIPSAFGLALTATSIASLYPAWFASRTDPASALRVDR
ncbi:MAG: ABC transporter permease [Myxococcales bacterium]|nr:ABC transporter permease [Myxococcales bacterium]